MPASHAWEPGLPHPPAQAPAAAASRLTQATTGPISETEAAYLHKRASGSLHDKTLSTFPADKAWDGLRTTYEDFGRCLTSWLASNCMVPDINSAAAPNGLRLLASLQGTGVVSGTHLAAWVATSGQRILANHRRDFEALERVLPYRGQGLGEEGKLLPHLVWYWVAAAKAAAPPVPGAIQAFHDFRYPPGSTPGQAHAALLQLGALCPDTINTEAERARILLDSVDEDTLEGLRGLMDTSSVAFRAQAKGRAATEEEVVAWISEAWQTIKDRKPRRTTPVSTPAAIPATRTRAQVFHVTAEPSCVQSQLLARFPSGTPQVQIHQRPPGDGPWCLMHQSSTHDGNSCSTLRVMKADGRTDSEIAKIIRSAERVSRSGYRPPRLVRAGAGGGPGPGAGRGRGPWGQPKLSLATQLDIVRQEAEAFSRENAQLHQELFRVNQVRGHVPPPAAAPAFAAHYQPLLLVLMQSFDTITAACQNLTARYSA